MKLPNISCSLVDYSVPNSPPFFRIHVQTESGKAFDNPIEAERVMRLIEYAPAFKLGCEGALNALRLDPHVDKDIAIKYLEEILGKFEKLERLNYETKKD